MRGKNTREIEVSHQCAACSVAGRTIGIAAMGCEQTFRRCFRRQGRINARGVLVQMMAKVAGAYLAYGRYFMPAVRCRHSPSKLKRQKYQEKSNQPTVQVHTIFNCTVHLYLYLYLSPPRR